MRTAEVIETAFIKTMRSSEFKHWHAASILAIITYSPEMGQVFNEFLGTLPSHERTQLVWALTCVAFKDAKRNEPYWADLKADVPTAYLQLYHHSPASEQSEMHSTAS